MQRHWMGKRKAAPKALPSYSLSGREAGEVVLYVGNLPTGLVTEPMLKELFSAPLLTLPGGAAANGVLHTAAGRAHSSWSRRKSEDASIK